MSTTQKTNPTASEAPPAPKPSRTPLSAANPFLLSELMARQYRRYRHFRKLNLAFFFALGYLMALLMAHFIPQVWNRIYFWFAGAIS
ncbi:hypothetical protein [uncultured Umboniibacter sp.]|uniref:hypothetical protein n=1 Tax=uncultured Umboniibacter sp. TaxID=1798917 RepID=UPI0026271831|nr:hypothetical protein [uncultured Umboniibacter sp.]